MKKREGFPPGCSNLEKAGVGMFAVLRYDYGSTRKEFRKDLFSASSELSLSLESFTAAVGS